MALRSGMLLDCDGTLMDSIGAWHAAEAQVMEQADVTLSKSQRDELNALTLEEAGDFFFDRFGIGESGADVVRMIEDYMIEFYRTRAVANPGALPFVKALRDAGVPTCVLSSSPQKFLQPGLERGGFLPYLDAVISVDDLKTTKRDRETYALVCDRMGVDVEATWLFDDSWYALRCAREAGCRTCGVYSTDLCGTHEELARYCDLVVDDFTGLKVADFLP